MATTVRAAPLRKFSDPDRTANGARRARVPLDRLRTLWINTGTLCNIACRNCYIESSPTNDALAYIIRSEAAEYFDEVRRDAWPVTEIGFTGGEPFMNPDILGMLKDALQHNFSVLILTNAMQPMARPAVKNGLLELHRTYGNRLKLRISLDHYAKAMHDKERGPGSFDKTVEGINWLAEHGFAMDLAGRTCWGEVEKDTRSGYAALIERHGWPVNAADPASLILFPEMDEQADVPEITDSCWDILNSSPSDVMCASSRMVVKRKGEAKPVLLPCTLITQDRSFDMGATLAVAARADGGMFDHGAVKLCHRHCAKFCVLGGGSCSATAPK